VTDYGKKAAGTSANAEAKADSAGKGDASKDSALKDKDSGTKKDSKPKAESGSTTSEKK